MNSKKWPYICVPLNADASVHAEVTDKSVVGYTCTRGVMFIFGRAIDLVM